jgi:hypothetical protein
MPIPMDSLGGGQRKWSTHIVIDATKEDKDDLRYAIRQSKADVVFLDYCGMELNFATLYVKVLFCDMVSILYF